MAPQEKLDQLLKLTERYCVVFQTLFEQAGPGRHAEALTRRFFH